MPGHATVTTDATLLDQYARTRDADAFSELVRRYAGLVYGTALRVTRNADDAEDVAQECFLELARKADSVTSSLPGWLHSTARHRSINAIRNASRRRRYERHTVAERHSDVEPTWDDIAPYVDEALDALSEELRVPIMLHYFQGHSQSQIASQLSVSQPTVSRLLEKGVAELRRHLKAAGIVPSVAILAALLTEHGATAAPDTLMVSLTKMAIAGVGKAGSAGGTAVSAGSTGSSSILSTSLLGTVPAKIALGVAVGGIIVVAAMAVRHGPGPTPQAAATRAAAHDSTAADRKTTDAPRQQPATGERPRPIWGARSEDAIMLTAAAVALADPKAPDAAPDDDVLKALAAKAAAMHDYHYRLEWTIAGGIRVYAIEVWYAGPDQMRMATGLGGQEDPLSETIVSGDEAYAIDSHQCEVTKLGASDSRRHLSRSPEQGMPLFLSGELLALWGKAEVKGAAAVGGAPCQIVDVAAADAALWGSLEHDADFVVFVPHSGQSSGSRLWVDGETGMVRRWGRVTSGRVRETAEVTETQQVNGFAFPALINVKEGGVEGAGRITEAAVNQGVEDAIADFRPPADWLVQDETLTLDQLRERLEADPQDANLHYTLGTLYEQRGQWQDAFEEFRRAADLAPESPTPLFALGFALRRAPGGNEGQTIDALRQGIARAGECSWLAGMQLVEALKGAGRTDEAIGECRELMGAGPPLSYWVVSELAGLLAREGDFEGAYRAAAEVPVAMLGPLGSELGLIVEWATKSGNLDDLRAKAEQAAAADSESGEAQLLLAKVLHAQGHQAEAAEALKAIRLPLGSPYPVSMAEVVSLARELGEEEFAAQAQRPAIKQAIESGRGWEVRRTLGGEELTEAAVSELVREAAAMWGEAADAQSRAQILHTVSDAVQSMRRGDRRGEAALARGPEELTPTECAIAGALAAAVADWGHEPEEVEEARQRAEAYFERALSEWRDAAALWAEVGELRRSAKDWQGAVEAYGKAAAADADEIEYLARVAFALARLERCDEALDTGRKAVEPWADQWVAQAFFCSLQMNCEQFEPARDTLVAIYASPEVQKSHQKTSVGRLLVRCHERLGELEQAEAILKRGVEEVDQWNQSEAYRRLMQFYARHGRRKDVYAIAKTIYVEAAEGDWQRRLAVSETRQAFEDDDEALAAAVRADLEAHAGDADTLKFAAALLERMGKLDEALPLLSEAAAEASDAEVWIRLADMAERAENGALAADALQRALDLRPDDEDLRLRYTRAAAAQGDTEAAKALADELRAGAGDSADTWRALAELYLTAESWDDVLAAAERVLALTPEADAPAQMRAQVLVARAYAGKRDDHEARRRLIGILARAQDHPLVLREAADALVDLYLLRNERGMAIATIDDLRLRTQDPGLLDWADQRLREIAGE